MRLNIRLNTGVASYMFKLNPEHLSSVLSQQVVPMRSHPAKPGEGFDAPPTIKRSGSEHQRAVTSFPFREGKAWLGCGAPFG